MDDIDYKLITLLEENCRTPLKELAAQVFLSSPAVAARIAHMEKSGLISGYHAYISAVEAGYPIKAFVNLEVKPSDKDVFYPFISDCPNVTQCNCVTGDYSMLIEGYFRTTQELDLFVGKLQQYGKTQTQIVFSTPIESRGIDVVKLRVKK